MKFIAFDKNSIDALIQARTLQSQEYEQAQEFCRTIKALVPSSLPNAEIIATKSGLYVQAKRSPFDKSSCLVIDLESTGLTSYSDKEILGIIQKTLRFSKKVRDGLGFSASEAWVPGLAPTFGMIYPFQFCETPTKVFVDVQPDGRRQERRNQNHHLCFKISTGHVDCENRSLISYNKFLEEVKGLVIAQATAATGNIHQNGVISNHSFDEIRNTISLDTLDFDAWGGYLTKVQKEFITNSKIGPTKISGPAGSGKTLSLILKALYTIKNAEPPLRVLFATHSESMKLVIESTIKKIFPKFSNGDIFNPPYLEIETLQNICRKKSTEKLSDTELLDSDSMDAKITQTLHIEHCISEFIRKDYATFENVLSVNLNKVFHDFAKEGKQFEVADLFQTEISTIIKGRANGVKDTYISLERPKYGLPIDKNNESDFVAIFYIFSMYQERLESMGVFDTDDIVISALNTLDSPIWNRRRAKEGFDLIFIDETHLFNFNELSVFHKLLAKPKDASVIFAYDQVQSPTDLGIGKLYLQEAFGDTSKDETNLGSVFRCSKPVVDLAEFIISSGVSFFSDFPNAHAGAESSTTFEQEAKVKPIRLISELGLDMVAGKAFSIAEEIFSTEHFPRNEILICATDEEVFKELDKFGISGNKPFKKLDRRSDFAAIQKAKEGNLFVLSHIDQVGGTEFSNVIIVGADKNRFPLVSAGSDETKHYHEFRSLNKLYVAITRARFSVTFVSDKSQGPSEILTKAISSNLIE